ncbi:hypothetical protein GUJ93_ZPchr0014g47109 [Zizania palustris]|uniref:Uncharacterized protein n=1 Tax=Zizania palustris TaxID=103762 RepID=A0A8J5TFM8_ZIZPA|nr:hypothetical protein GUJ93_ZPchr0014g47109 [Zizania palustris]
MATAGSPQQPISSLTLNPSFSQPRRAAASISAGCRCAPPPAVARRRCLPDHPLQPGQTLPRRRLHLAEPRRPPLHAVAACSTARPRPCLLDQSRINLQGGVKNPECQYQRYRLGSVLFHG